MPMMYLKDEVAQHIINFKKNKRYQLKISLLWAWLEIFFTPKRYLILKQHRTSCQIFSAQHPKLGTAKAPAVDLLRLNSLRATKATFLNTKRYDKHPCAFHIGVPPG